MTGRLALVILCVAATSAADAPSHAQCRLCENPTTLPESGEEGSAVAIQIDAGLDFDKLILTGSGDGQAVLRPDGTRETSGMIGPLGMGAMVGQARVRGEPGRFVRIQLPRQVELHSVSGGRILIEEIISDLPDLPRLDSSGSLTFRFGGRLHISGDSEGEYRGDVPIMVEYL